MDLASLVCAQQGWNLSQVRFYTGVPDASDHPHWNQFWNAKLAALGRRGVFTYSRPLRYQTQVLDLPDGKTHTYRSGHEKGIDIRIALDVINLALEDHCDVALLFSQDQDFSEVAREVRVIAGKRQRWIKMASAYPVSATLKARRGIEGTDWIRIDKEIYDRCLDPTDYRSRHNPS